MDVDKAAGDVTTQEDKPAGGITSSVVTLRLHVHCKDTSLDPVTETNVRQILSLIRVGSNSIIFNVNRVWRMP